MKTSLFGEDERNADGLFDSLTELIDPCVSCQSGAETRDRKNPGTDVSPGFTE